MSYRLVESEAGNFSLFRSKQNVLTNHLQGRARNKRADDQSRKIRCGATGLWTGVAAKAKVHKHTPS